jgi:hypothetical protein
MSLWGIAAGHGNDPRLKSTINLTVCVVRVDGAVANKNFINAL